MEDDMGTQEGGPDESRRDVTTRARQRANRILAGSSAAIATMRRKAASGSLAAWLRAHVPAAWRRPRRLMLVGAVLLVVIALIITTRPTISRHPAPGTTVFPIGQRVVLRFVHSTGSVHVRAGPDGQVSITEHRSGMTDAIHTRYRQQGDVITATISIDKGLFVDTWVDFTVAVPRDTHANVATAAGTLKAAGLTGNFVLQDTNGSIWAGNIKGAVALQTESGSINASQVSGQVRAITDNGTITTNSTRLRGQSVMQAQNGTINFHGSLDPGCHALFRNTNGAIGVTLPSRSSVLVDARTPHGSINSEFSTVHVVPHSAGRVANGRVGRGAPARLSIRTMGGSIDLNHGT
jgi:Putative adhesin